MIEITHDKHSPDFLVYTDEADMAKKFRREFKCDGAKYSGKENGYSWVAPKCRALDCIRRSGIKSDSFKFLEK